MSEVVVSQWGRAVKRSKRPGKRSSKMKVVNRDRALPSDDPIRTIDIIMTHCVQRIDSRA
jgi:hypothetical protein